MQQWCSTIRRPIQTQKSEALQEIISRYTFEVAMQATKPEIKQAVEFLFSVKVLHVRTTIVHGKCKRAGGLMRKRSHWKKASVTLKPGQKIDFYSKNGVAHGSALV
jgi:large subunit ribosomal protein L23